MSTKLTRWFPPEVKPVHRGVYAIGAPYQAPWFRLWDGVMWHEGAPTSRGAMNNGDRFPYFDAKWRGLVEKPA